MTTKSEMVIPEKFLLTMIDKVSGNLLKRHIDERFSPGSSTSLMQVFSNCLEFSVIEFEYVDFEPIVLDRVLEFFECKKEAPIAISDSRDATEDGESLVTEVRQSFAMGYCRDDSRAKVNNLVIVFAHDRSQSRILNPILVDSLRQATKQFADMVLESRKIYEEQKRNQNPGNIHLLCKRNSVPYLQMVAQKKSEKLRRENYSEQVVATHNRVIKEISKKNPRGKIAIYQGPPGTGKTFAIRNLVSSLKECFVVLISPSMLEDLTSPEFLALMLENSSHGQPIIFILEDADEILSERTEKNRSAVSALLNLGDGILGSILDTRIIASANLQIGKFDEAVTRSGRLIEIVDFPKLEPTRSAKVIRKLLPKMSDDDFGKVLYRTEFLTQPMRLSDCYEFASNYRNKISNSKYNAS
jgi:hypothetical protein